MLYVCITAAKFPACDSVKVNYTWKLCASATNKLEYSKLFLHSHKLQRSQSNYYYYNYN